MNAKIISFTFDFGTFEGFNFRDQSAIEQVLTAEDVANWDHDLDGEAEFWPDGDNEYIWLIFKSNSNVTVNDLFTLEHLLYELGDDSGETYLKIYYCIECLGYSLKDVTPDMVQDADCMVFSGDSFIESRREAAYEIFETYYPEEYAVWEKSLCDGLFFDEDRFLDSPVFSVTEVRVGDQAILLISWN